MKYIQGMSIFIFMLISFPLYAQDRDALGSARQDFLKAERALQQDDQALYDQLKVKLKDYPLYPYLEYEGLAKQIRLNQKHAKQTVPFETIESFAQRYPNLPILNKLLYQWLHVQAKQKDWENFLKGYALRNRTFYATSIHCLNVYAEYQTTQQAEHLKKGLPFWLVGKSQPPSCNALFRAMKKQGILTQEHVVERFYQATKNRHHNLSSYLVTLMPSEYQQEAILWMKLSSNPKKIASTSMLDTIKTTQFKDPMLKVVLYRLARSDLKAAQTVFTQLNERKALSPELRAHIKQDIAIRLAHQKAPDALEWLNAIPQGYLNEVASQWLVRLSLMQGQWENVKKHIDAMGPLKDLDLGWQYWRARAEIVVGDPKKARFELEKISKQRSYYGFLASEWLQKPYTFADQPIQLLAEHHHTFKQVPAIQRVHELFHLNRIIDAKREWLRYCETLNEDLKIQAAHYAQRQQWHDLAIFTMTRADHKDDLKLRFPLGFEQSITKYAHLQSLDPAWIFALTRQESAFAHHVRSPVGATGLMQLMPSTAQYVARKNQMPIPTTLDLTNPDINIALGTTYLNDLNQTLNGQMVLATASYNAGINRIKTWLPNQPLESDIWIETMPFEETRNYVKNVLTYMGIYKSLLNEPFRLSWVMSPVTPPPNAGDLALEQ